ncbi:MAG: MMPL family transporter [Microbacteriaceae bacterium]|nr:MMPL family transporter [Microbacteriaceae bacterium]
MFLNKTYRFWPALIAMVLSTALAGVMFLLSATTEEDTAPESGAPTASESAEVARIVAEFPDTAGTSMFLVFTKASELSDAELTTINENVAEVFADYTDIPVAIPALVSDDGTTASAIIPLEKTNVVDEQKERYNDIRDTSEAGLSGVDVFLSGPEGFVVDISNVFAGANFTLLLVTASVVILLLLVTYRSPVLWIIPLLVVGLADFLAGAMAEKTAQLLGGQLDGSTTGILSVLVFGAGTNYALLIISRYREELLKFESRADAMAKAVRGTAPAILASGGTVLVAMVVLWFAQLDSSRNLGLAGFVGIAVAMIAGIIVLPFALVIWPRWIFWPLTPQFGSKPRRESLWARAGRTISLRPVLFSIGSAVLAIGLALPALGIQTGLTANERFLTKPGAVIGIETLTEKFEQFQGSGFTVMASEDDVEAVQAFLDDNSDILVEIVPPPLVTGPPIPGPVVAPAPEPEPTFSTVGESIDGWTQITATLDFGAESDESKTSIADLRVGLDSVGDGKALVGGGDAQVLDTELAIEADQGLVFPTVLAAVLLVLILVLRSLVAPVILLATVVASYFAALGASWALFQTIWGFPALDGNVLVLSFLFLVALGIDYNMFLMTRVKEEAEIIVNGKPVGIKQGMVAALGATGGVITSAGVLLAAVFAVLGVLPLITLTQIGVIVCVGVLLDTLLVRTVVVPSLTFLVGERMWLPRKTGVSST